MANHAFITSHRHFPINNNGMLEVLEEICLRRFNGTICFIREEPYWLCYFKENKQLIFSMWPTSHRKLEMRHPHGDFQFWIFMTVQNELALKYDGWISDEGVSDRWRGNKKKYLTYRSWFFKRWEPNAKAAQKQIFKNIISHLPKSVQKWAAT